MRARCRSANQTATFRSASARADFFLNQIGEVTHGIRRILLTRFPLLSLVASVGGGRCSRDGCREDDETLREVARK